MEEPRRPHRIARGLRVSGAVLVVLLVLAEAGVRLAGPRGEPPPLRFRFANRQDANMDEEESLYRRSDFLFWEPRPGARTAEGDRINSLGLRGPEVAVEDPDDFRIAVLGDSCTFGTGVAYENAYGVRLGKILREEHTGADVQILNAGVPAYSVFQGRRRFERDIVPLGPDGAVLYFGAWNDFNPAMSEGMNDLDLGRGAAAAASERVYDFLCHSRLFELVALRYAGTVRYRNWRATMDAWLDGEPPYGDRVPLEDFDELFASFLDRCLELDLRVLVVLPELNGSMREENPVHWPRLEDYRSVMRAAAQERGIAIVDERELFAVAPHEKLFVDIVHPSARGHRILARALADVIDEEGWLK